MIKIPNFIWIPIMWISIMILIGGILLVLSIALDFVTENISGISYSNKIGLSHNKPIRKQISYCDDVIVSIQRYKDVIVFHSTYTQNQKYQLLDESNKTIYKYNAIKDSLEKQLKGEVK